MPNALKGFNDIVPGRPAGGERQFLDAELWAHLFEVSSRTLEAWGYVPTWLPLAESTALFSRGLGESSDVVAKEMYTFEDRGGRSMTLRPEGTAGAARAYVEHQVGRQPGPHRWYYAGPMFRAERPQKGRYRQFYQLGAECFGVASELADVEMLMMLQALCAAWGLRNVRIDINTLGDAQSRAAYRQALLGFCDGRRADLCANCQGRLVHNVLRLLDCKNAACQAVLADAPDIADSLSDAAAQRFAATCAHLAALQVPVTRQPRLVRGLDYYTDLIFEFVETSDAAAPAGLGAQATLLGGGRYDGLVAELGGPATPAVGFSAGLERIALLLCAQQQALGDRPIDLLLLPLDPPGQLAALQLAQQVRQQGWRVEVDLLAGAGKLKAGLRRADRLGHRFALVLGDSERRSQRAQLKNLRQHSVHEVALSAAALQAALQPGHSLDRLT